MPSWAIAIIILLMLDLAATTALLWCVALRYKVIGQVGEPRAKIPYG
jgi:hypothetical protein